MNLLRALLLCPTLLWLVLASCASSQGVYHVVKEGQTLYRISREYRVQEAYLARINNISDPTELPVGKRLFIPDAKRVLNVPATVKPDPPATVFKPRPVTSTRPGNKTPPTKVTKPSTTTTVKAPAPDKSRFSWPLKGKIIRCFSANGKDPCKGIEISVAKNTPVKAAAAGSVIYSGNGIRGYGNLIIIKHDNSFFTVYGYSQRNLVNSGAYVSKGQKIAYSGTPPGGGVPRLHFEVRHGKKSVDPVKYLP
ncbi:MAG: peptidase [Desulfuromonas sp.]|nr:MAG: peptidase [Desulfuromonas sp.]